MKTQSMAKQGKPGRNWGWILVIFGSFISAIGLIFLAVVIATEFIPNSTVDDLIADLWRSAICILPIFLVGIGLLIFGIRKIRTQRGKPISKEFGGYRTKTEKEAWAQAMVGAEFMSEGKFQDALAIAEQALAKFPQCKEAWVVKGGALSTMMRLQEALACYEQALEIDPDYKEALVQKDIVQESLKLLS